MNYETPYIEKLMQEVRHRSYDPDSAYAHRIKSFQESDAKLNDERSLFDWASKTNVYTNDKYDECGSSNGDGFMSNRKDSIKIK